jgi:NAD(P)-dependent dehydrogenase (short-subunit alcohol dehydrogenase family)
MKTNKIALVTGANKGIGLEIARGLGRLGITVLMGCRNESLGASAAAALSAEGLDVRNLPLDVTDAASITAAAAAIGEQFGRLDILVNNAGVSFEKGEKPSVVDLDLVRKVYEVNLFGAIAVTQALLPLIRKSAQGRIVNVSSGLGSLTLHQTPGAGQYRFLLLGYCSSKSALNAVTVQFANELHDTGIKVNAACPGYCATDLNNFAGPRTPAQGAQTPVRLATLADDGPTGGYFDDDGAVPW